MSIDDQFTLLKKVSMPIPNTNDIQWYFQYVDVKTGRFYEKYIIQYGDTQPTQQSEIDEIGEGEE